MLTVSDLNVHYDTPAGLVRSVNGVSFEVGDGETVALVGESGCGKSTLGKSLLQLAPVTSGSILYDGTDLARATAREMLPFRRRISMIFQDPFASLNPRHTIAEIIETPLKVHGVSDRRARASNVEKIIDQVGLPRTALHRYPHEFSGGQRQRIVIARALVLEPSFIVCDEPISALDLSIQAQIINLLVEMKQRHNLSLLFISHDLSVVRYIADRVLVMYLGRIVEHAAVDQLWRHQAHPYTRALMQSVPSPLNGRNIAPIAGDLPSPTAIPPGCAFHRRCPLATSLCSQETPVLRTLEVGHSVACHHAETLPS